MFNLFNRNAKSAEQQLRDADYAGQLAAISKVQAVIEFNMDGTIITANDNFLSTVGYGLDEVQGQHHSMFVTPEYKVSAEYRQFWERLNRGEYEAQEYKRIGKGGKEVWIQASYNPIMDLNGKPFKIVKYATDVTARKLANADFTGQIAAISKAQAVIEFNMDGTIITANDNFLSTVGYGLDEVQGQHHSMFVTPEYKASAEYRQFWEKLNRGEYDAQEYMRIGKGGKEIWIQASYNPIMDLNGKPFKVVKYAIDVTEQKMMSIHNGRIGQALDGVTSNVMIGDNDLNIVYMNETVVELFRDAEADIRKDLPNFDAKNLMGTCIDVFHKNPAHQRTMLAGLDFPGLRIDNGSGLSRNTRITARSLMRLLLAADRSLYRAEFVSSLALAGMDGTMRRRFRDKHLAGRMHLKTGRLDDVFAMAGYVRSRSGDDYVVVAIQNGVDAHRGPGEEAQSALLRWVHQQ